MKKLLALSLVSIFTLTACSDKNDNDSAEELIKISKEQQKKQDEEDTRAKKAMDMSQGAKVYPIPEVRIGQ